MQRRPLQCAAKPSSQGLNLSMLYRGGNVLGGILASIILLGVLYSCLRWKAVDFDKNCMIALSIGVVLLWIIPWGLFVIAPLVLATSIISPAARTEWNDFRKRRIITSVVLLLVLNLSAFYPTAIPDAPDEWGKPIAVENPYAPSWPSSHQYTWYYQEEQAVIGIVNTRTPHTFSSIGHTSSTLTLGVMLGMHEERLRQSIEIMNDRVPLFSIDPESFTLNEVESESTHNYGNSELEIKRFEVKVDGFDTPLASVLVVGFSSPGGELTLLTISKSLLSNQDDVFEEKIVLQYLD